MNNTNETATAKKDTTAVMSPQEHDILNVLVRESEPLPFPTAILKMSVGPDVEEYVIPEEQKQEILEKVYPFMPCPKVGDTLYDLHECRKFNVRDFKVIRENGRNLLVSPYYARSGGMVVDWMPDEMASGGTTIMQLKEAPEAPGINTVVQKTK